MMAISQTDGPRVSKCALERTRDFQIATSQANHHTHLNPFQSRLKITVPVFFPLLEI